MRLRLLLCATLIFLGVGSAFAVEPEKFELKDGDRVVFLGNTLIEREQKYGYWELMLTMAWPERNVTFRNLGWSGDTVWGESRAGFGSQVDGFKKLVEEVNAAKPTVIFVGYGNVEAFDGEAGLPKFVEGFGKLLDVLEATKARIVVLGPIRQAESISKFPGVKQYNQDVVRYAAEMKGIATKRSHLFIDLIRVSDAIHLTVADNFLVLAAATTTDGLDVTEIGYMGLWEIEGGIRSVIPGREFDLGNDAASKLLSAIIKKNELFFHRWRPQNETYLFGFRKHEQGKNAAEVFQFDPLVEAEERKIAELRVKLAAELKNGGAK